MIIRKVIDIQQEIEIDISDEEIKDAVAIIPFDQSEVTEVVNSVHTFFLNTDDETIAKINPNAREICAKFFRGLADRFESCEPPAWKRLKCIAKQLRAEGMVCNCDLDRWEPEPDTGHSHVCRIHKKAKAIAEERREKGCGE